MPVVGQDRIDAARDAYEQALVYAQEAFDLADFDREYVWRKEAERRRNILWQLTGYSE